MATIKDVAKAANVSVTTVSLIINGKATEHRITEETQRRVQKVMNEMGYQPNTTARRLRSETVPNATIALYWPADYRSNILSSFLGLFPEVRDELGLHADLVVRSYQNGELLKAADPIRRNAYNGVIIGAMSAEDLDCLESLSTQTPIVIMNRNSKKYSTVGSDNVQMGRLAARLMDRRGYKEAAVFTSTRPYMATSLRVQGFLYACAELGINVESEYIYRSDNTICGGASSASAYVKKEKRPKAIFCDSDSIALGALHVFYENGLHFPDDVELLAVQLMSDDFAAYANPALTTLPMPNRVILQHALKILMDYMRDPLREPVHETIPVEIRIRDTFR